MELDCQILYVAGRQGGRMSHLKPIAFCCPHLPVYRLMPLNGKQSFAQYMSRRIQIRYAFCLGVSPSNIAN